MKTLADCGNAGAAFGEVHLPAARAITMNKSPKRKFRLTIECNDHAVLRLSVKERSGEGNYQRIEHPWGVKDLAAFKLAATAATLVSRGVANLDEICRTVTAPRRRKVGKKRLAEDSALQTNRSGLRHNGSDKGVAHNA